MASHCFLLNESSMSGESDGEIGFCEQAGDDLTKADTPP